jgi:hypothetical protein
VSEGGLVVGEATVVLHATLSTAGLLLLLLLLLNLKKSNNKVTRVQINSNKLQETPQSNAAHQTKKAKIISKSP